MRGKNIRTRGAPSLSLFVERYLTLTLNHSKLRKLARLLALEWILIVNIHRRARNHSQQKHNEIKGLFDTSRTMFPITCGIVCSRGFARSPSSFAGMHCMSYS